MLKLCQICPGETISGWLHSYWHVLVIIFSFKHIIIFWHNKMFQGHLILFPSEPWNWLFSQSAMVPFSGEWHLETNVWEMGCSVLLRKMHLLNFWQQDAFYRLWCVLIHWSGIWLFFLLATFLFNLKLSSAVSPLPGLLSHPSCPFLCPVHTPSVLSPFSTEPQPGSPSSTNSAWRFYTKETCCRARWISLGFYRILISAFTNLFCLKLGGK